MGSAVSSLIAAFIVFYTGDFKSIFIYSTIPYFLDLILISSYPKSLEGKSISLKTEKIKESLLKVLRDFIFSFKNTQILRQ